MFWMQKIIILIFCVFKVLQCTVWTVQITKHVVCDTSKGSLYKQYTILGGCVCFSTDRVCC